MKLRDVILHFRFPFSLFLMPVYLYALSQVHRIEDRWAVWGSFIVWHVFIYPASNAYNSYFDKDEGSIGGLKSPPPVTEILYWISLLWTALGVGLAFVVHVLYGCMVLVYVLVSKAYSHPAIRLKRHPYLGWLAVVLFQGAWVYMATVVAVAPGEETEQQHRAAALLSSLMLAATYPLTQVYQHEEDRQRGDLTLSLRLGVKGTFLWASFFLLLTALGHVAYAYYFADRLYLLVLSGCLLLPGIYFFYWMRRAYRRQEATYEEAMRMNITGAMSMNIAFATLLALRYLVV
ncbi:UbiA family prenyltransferase [Thermonema rossianum]|uniref:UbiA family prenyltransferase n=1 Tax=Thermonema rossianum TaxID=55505 RepID=UPI000570E31F|nr:UbiA family prenyltransferase [Thermonema rossianum]